MLRIDVYKWAWKNGGTALSPVSISLPWQILEMTSSKLCEDRCYELLPISNDLVPFLVRAQ